MLDWGNAGERSNLLELHLGAALLDLLLDVRGLVLGRALLDRDRSALDLRRRRLRGIRDDGALSCFLGSPRHGASDHATPHRRRRAVSFDRRRSNSRSKAAFRGRCRRAIPLASLRPRPVIVRTILRTAIFLSAGTSLRRGGGGVMKESRRRRGLYGLTRATAGFPLSR